MLSTTPSFLALPGVIGSGTRGSALIRRLTAGEGGEGDPRVGLGIASDCLLISLAVDEDSFLGDTGRAIDFCSEVDAECCVSTEASTCALGPTRLFL